MNAPPAPGWHAVEIERIRSGARAADLDRCAIEAPLDIRLHGQSFVMTMRTPGDDADLAAGFLLSEGVVGKADDLIAIRPSSDNASVDVTLGSGAATQLEHHMAARRQVTATSACGVCGRQSSDALAFDAAPIIASWTIPAAVVDTLPSRLRAAQATFDQTGGLHAAGVFALDGSLIESAEDVGRHNAVDKVIGRLLRARRLPLAECVLCVSGRASFELVQKAVRGGLPMLVAVSAPSSLAIELARQRGVTLAGFVRGDGFNVYAHAQRIA